jgi:hypothetical protein
MDWNRQLLVEHPLGDFWSTEDKKIFQSSVVSATESRAWRVSVRLRFEKLENFEN